MKLKLIICQSKVKKVFLVLMALVDFAFGSLLDDGAAKAAEGDLDGAIADYTKAIELKTNTAAVYNNRGLLYQREGNLNGAIADYTKAINLDTNFSAAYRNRGFAKQTQFDFQGAIADYNKAIELKPDDNEAQNLRNLLAYAKYESTKSRPVVYLQRGIVKEKADDDLDGAIADYNKAIKLNPDFASAYFHRGYAETRKGSLDSAIEDYTKAVNLEPDFAWAYNNRGWCEFLKNDFDSAINDATRAIQLNSTNRNFYDTRGWARYGKGDTAGALTDCEKAVGLSAIGSWEAVETQGLVNFINGDYQMAYQQLNNSFQNDPSKRYLLPFIEKAKAKLNLK